MITISEKSKCTGCYGCVNVCPKRCITMETDQEGFRYPKVETGECISCGLCIDTCPILMNTENENDGMPLAYAANNRDNEIRQDSSSGGLFNLLAERILNSGGVVFGARFDNNFDVRKCRGFMWVTRFKICSKQDRECLSASKNVLGAGETGLLQRYPLSDSRIKSIFVKRL